VRAVVVKTINFMLVFSPRDSNTDMDEWMERQKKDTYVVAGIQGFSVMIRPS
jgi:hypothetical protein